ncbi:MAG: hypothetical protein K8U03_01150 [Planctomycetia bacterium]|nr:hypothetical protein [Planctomycetia bacterium]
MVHRLLLTCSIILLSAGSLSAFDAVGTLKSLDAENGVLVVFAGGQDRTLTADRNLRVLDKDGKELAAGLKSSELKADAQVTVTVEPNNGRIILRAIRLGANAPQGQGPGPGRPPGGAPMQPGRTSVGLKPLNEMTASDVYKGEDGGLYGGGKNEPPSAHAAAAKKETARILPRSTDGKPSPDGKIVLISISMSNATQEFSTFKRIADAEERKSSQLTIVDCAQGGQTMAAWARADARAWDEAERRLTAAGVSPEQVQIAWIKLANAGPSGELNEHGKRLYDDTLVVLQLAKEKFPNLRIAYLGSRIYAGYATTRLNPEPYAYEGAFIVRRLIRDQIQGKDALNFDAAQGSVKTPLVLWGPYLWGDGMTPRKQDGLIWERSDLAEDGTHPTHAGQRKVADILLKFFADDTDAKTWFVGK